jgi:hypothetical protein
MNQRELTNPSLFHTASISKTNVVSCDKGVVVQSILFFDLQFTCSHVLFRTRWLVFSWFIVVQEGSSSHVLFFALPGLLLLTRIIVWTVDKWTSFQNATFLASLLDSEGFWQTIDSDILALLTFFERFCCEKNGSIYQRSLLRFPLVKVSTKVYNTLNGLCRYLQGAQWMWSAE